MGVVSGAADQSEVKATRGPKPDGQLNRLKLWFLTKATLVPRNQADGDIPYYAEGEPVKSNAQLVERIVRIAKELGSEIARPDDVRKILGLHQQGRQS